MNLLRLFVFVALTFVFTGCESVSERMAERFDTGAPQTKAFPADQKTTYYAAQKALKRMDFVLTRSAQAQGIVNAQSSMPRHCGLWGGPAVHL